MCLFPRIIFVWLLACCSGCGSGSGSGSGNDSSDDCGSWGSCDTPPALTIATASLAGGRVGDQYQVALKAEGGSPPYTWSIANGQLPPGLVLSGGGTLSGRPTQAANNQVAIALHDAGSNSANITYTLHIDPATLSITTAQLPDGMAGESYRRTLAAEGGTPPYRWQIMSGGLPAGLSLNQSSGVISGTPTGPADTDVTISVSDAAAASTDKALSLQVLPAPLSITTTQLPNGVTGTAYRTTLAAAGGTPPYRWQLMSGALPPGLSLNQTSGVISGTPNNAAAANFTISVSDAGSSTVSADFGLAVSAPGTGWQLVWSDEFDGTTLDGTKWLNPTNDNSCNGYTEQKVMADDSYLDGNGHLVIRAQSRASGGCGSRHLTAGQISTKGRFSQAYGRYEFRAQLPSGGGGVWPALWLYPIGVSWPPEVDILEAISDMSTAYMTYHWSSSNQQSGATYSDPKLKTGYHTYTFEWEPGRMDWYIDGVKARATFTGPDVTSMPMGILIDIYLGGWAGSVTASFPQYMYVDYVRVYSRQ